MQRRQQTIKTFGLTTLVLGALLSGCAFQTYTAKPLDANSTSIEFLAHDPLGAEFQAYLQSQGYEERQTPVLDWGLNEVIYSALYFHSDLDVARATWRASLAAEKTAGQRPNPGISADVEHHSETDNGISPWTYGLAIDIPIAASSNALRNCSSASQSRLPSGGTNGQSAGSPSSCLRDHRAATVID